jgi:hypothetical protein
MGRQAGPFAHGLLAYVGKSASGRYDPFHFETDLAVEDVELSDDMFLLTAAEARKRMEPPRLSRLEIRPEHAYLGPGKSMTYTVRGLDQHGQDFSIGDVSWVATGGEMAETGAYRAGAEEGEFMVTADCGEITSTVRLTIAAAVKDKSDRGQPPAGPGGLRWAGEVPPQKWMNFYTRVLSRFVSAGGLTLRVEVTASPQAGMSPQQVDEVRAVLRELGLEGRVQTG